jgi:hypothetical protein
VPVLAKTSINNLLVFVTVRCAHWWVSTRLCQLMHRVWTTWLGNYPCLYILLIYMNTSLLSAVQAISCGSVPNLCRHGTCIPCLLHRTFKSPAVIFLHYCRQRFPSAAKRTKIPEDSIMFNTDLLIYIRVTK